MSLALTLIAVATLIAVPIQFLSIRTGLHPHAVPRLWHRIVLRALGIRVHVKGEMTAKRPLLVASNHVSWTDIMVIGSRVDVSFIAKSELAGWPLAGTLSRLQRTVFIERNARRKSGEQAGDIGRRLAANDAMVLFAEGTTGDGNRPLPFKSTLFGAAAIAIREGAAEKVFIQPTAVVYTRLHGLPMGRQHRAIISWIGDQDLWPHLKMLLGEGAVDVELHFGEALEYTAGTNRKDLARQVEAGVRTMMVDALHMPPGGWR